MNLMSLSRSKPNLEQPGPDTVYKVPVCQCCYTASKEVSSKPFLLGCDHQLCKQCWYNWYDGYGYTKGGKQDSRKIAAKSVEDKGAILISYKLIEELGGRDNLTTQNLPKKYWKHLLGSGTSTKRQRNKVAGVV